MPATLPNTTTTNDYKDTQLGGANAIFAKGQLLIANNPVSVRITTAFETGGARQTEFPYVTPTLLPLVSGAPTPQNPKPERLCLVEVKSAIPGSPAQVSGWLIEPALAGPDLGAEFSARVSSTGGVTPGLGSLQFQNNGVLIGTEPIFDLLPLDANFPWVMADDAANTRVTAKPPQYVVFDSIAGAPVASFDTGAIIPAGARMLKCILQARGDAVANSVGLNVFFNNDLAGNYEMSYVQADNAGAVTGNAAGGVAGIQGGGIPAANATAGRYGMYILEVDNYSSAIGNQNKPVVWRNFFDDNVGFFSRHGGGSWRTSAIAINRVSISPGAGNFIANSRFTVIAE